MIHLEPRQCTLCGPAEKKLKYPANFSEVDLNAANFSARRAPDRKYFRLMECGECGIIFSDPACGPEALAALYEHSTVNYDSQEKQIYASYAPILERALKLLKKRGTFVEIGGGTGFMLKFGAQNGFDSQIEVEPSADAEKRFVPASSRAAFVRKVFNRRILPPHSASLICFFQILDHAPDPGEFLRQVFEVLEPGGVAVCVTHNTDAVSAKILGRNSPIFDIAHTYLFNPRNMTRLFKRAGFGHVETFKVANTYAFQYWLNLAPIANAPKQMLLRLARRLGVAGIRMPFYAGNFATIAQKAHST